MGLSLESVLGKINLIRQNKPKVIIAIDGRSAAGKSTLAASLKERLECNIIPMDHFFLRPHQRTPQRLQEPGGNVDYERFLKEVLHPLTKKEAFSYRPYNCKKDEMDPPISIVAKEINIVEGAYSCHPLFLNFYDLKVFLTVEAKEQLERIKNRNGEKVGRVFQEKWIPLEENYFKGMRLGGVYEVVVDTTTRL